MSNNARPGFIGFSALVTMVFALTSAPAFAYLDPGSGSYFVQLVIAGMAGGAYLVKLYYGRIKSSIGSVFGKKKQEEKEKNK